MDYYTYYTIIIPQIASRFVYNIISVLKHFLMNQPPMLKLSQEILAIQYKSHVILDMVLF